MLKGDSKRGRLEKATNFRRANDIERNINYLALMSTCDYYMCFFCFQLENDASVHRDV